MSQRLGGVVKKKYFCILKHLKIENNRNIQNIEDINNDEETKQETEENKENFKDIF